MFISRHQNAGLNYNSLTDKKPFENSANSKYLGTAKNKN
jgi:hypothetical protein